jgi:hypothetical protein
MSRKGLTRNTVQYLFLQCAPKNIYTPPFGKEPLKIDIFLIGYELKSSFDALEDVAHK